MKVTPRKRKVGTLYDIELRAHEAIQIFLWVKRSLWDGKGGELNLMSGTHDIVKLRISGRRK